MSCLLGLSSATDLWYRPDHTLVSLVSESFACSRCSFVHRVQMTAEELPSCEMSNRCLLLESTNRFNQSIERNHPADIHQTGNNSATFQLNWQLKANPALLPPFLDLDRITSLCRSLFVLKHQHISVSSRLAPQRSEPYLLQLVLTLKQSMYPSICYYAEWRYC